MILPKHNDKTIPPVPIEERLGVLDRRRIEAMILGPVIRAYQDEIGREQAADVARRTITGIAREQGAAMAAKLGTNSLRAFASSKEPWLRNGALEIDVIEENDDAYAFNVTRCRYAEMYEELGFRDLGEAFSCTRDFEFSRGFNPDVKLTRTQTIMQGASHCDFRYELPQPASTQTDNGEAAADARNEAP